MPAPRLHLLVCSCARRADRRPACRETWLAQLPEGVTYQFLQATPPPADPEPDVLYLPEVRDTYPDLPTKIRAAIVCALTLHGWEWLGKCDDDTVLHLPRLLRYLAALPPDVPATGRLIRHIPDVPDAPFFCDLPPGKRAWTMGGAGYFMRRRVAHDIIAAHNSGTYTLNPTGSEDMVIASAIASAGYTWQHCPLLYNGRIPLDYATAISVHLVRPQHMAETFAALTASDTP